MPDTEEEHMTDYRHKYDKSAAGFLLELLLEAEVPFKKIQIATLAAKRLRELVNDEAIIVPLSDAADE